jgi:four helix bundle protein
MGGRRGDDEERVIPPRGDYQTLHAFHKAQVVYDIIFRFAHKYFSRGDRTIDQMIQAARSGKKNILEGSKAGRASKEVELKMTNSARGSLEELLDDYRDYLRVREHPEWSQIQKRHSTAGGSDAKFRKRTNFIVSS